jgi:hypothetical protein
MVGFEGGLEDLGGVDAQAGEKLGVGTRHAGRRLEQTVAVGVLAEGDQDLTDRALYPPEIDSRLHR